MSGALGHPQIFFGRCESWSEDDGWETVEARDFEEASVKFAEKWDLDDDEKISVIKAGPEPRKEFITQRRLVVTPYREEDDDEGPDSQR
jgi:hypothetical protein